MEHFVDGKKKEKLTVSDIEHVITDSLDIFDQSLVQSNVYQCYVSKIQLQKDIDALEKQKKALDKAAKRKTGMVYSFLYSLLLTEFSLFYYMIYEVSWLGWDLVEPLTYSIGQGYFLAGVYFYTRTHNDSNYTNLADFFNNRFRLKLYKKNSFEEERLAFLKTRMERLNAKIADLESA